MSYQLRLLLVLATVCTTPVLLAEGESVLSIGVALLISLCRVLGPHVVCVC